jgi:hypothetical protein
MITLTAETIKSWADDPSGPVALPDKEAVPTDVERVGMFARKGSKGCIDLAACAGIEDMGLKPKGPCGCLYLPQGRHARGV